MKLRCPERPTPLLAAVNHQALTLARATRVFLLAWNFLHLHLDLFRTLCNDFLPQGGKNSVLVIIGKSFESVW
jgi:hypothetical protein